MTLYEYSIISSILSCSIIWLIVIDYAIYKIEKRESSFKIAILQFLLESVTAFCFMLRFCKRSEMIISERSTVRKRSVEVTCQDFGGTLDGEPFHSNWLKSFESKLWIKWLKVYWNLESAPSFFINETLAGHKRGKANHIELIGQNDLQRRNQRKFHPERLTNGQLERFSWFAKDRESSLR